MRVGVHVKVHMHVIVCMRAAMHRTMIIHFPLFFSSFLSPPHPTSYPPLSSSWTKPSRPAPSRILAVVQCLPVSWLSCSSCAESSAATSTQICPVSSRSTFPFHFLSLPSRWTHPLPCLLFQRFRTWFRCGCMSLCILDSASVCQCVYHGSCMCV